jgi:hypothetical protein
VILVERLAVEDQPGRRPVMTVRVEAERAKSASWPFWFM